MSGVRSMVESINPYLERHLRDLSQAFGLWIADDDTFVIVSGLKLPPGYNECETDLLIELPLDYPLSPPGIGDNHVYLPTRLRRGSRWPLNLLTMPVSDKTL